MTAILGNIISNLQQAAETAKQAREARARSKTSDGRRIFRIACLGHANAGKTTFWTVLEGATRELSDQFNLQTGDNTTAAYLKQQRDVMQQGAQAGPGNDERAGARPGVYEPGYPEQTDLVANLLFMARQPGRPECPILLQDYPGGSVAVEDMTGGSAEIADFLKTADGVLFFFDSLVTRLSRAAIDQQLAAFRSLLRHIEDRRGHIAKPVGLVFTKADTLPGFRPGNPVALLQPSDLRHRDEPFSKFLEQLLRGAPYTQDPAWRDRLGKTMNRVQSFADVLLKKCASPQFFFVSAVGNPRHRPIEVSGDRDQSMVMSFVGTSVTGSVTLGKSRVGLEEPVAWMVNELSVRGTVNRARQVRNQALKLAAAWAVLVSLPFMLYLGCSTRRLEGDLRAPVIPAQRVLHDAHRFEQDWLARLWGVFDKRGFTATAREVQARTALKVQIAAQNNLESILNRACADPALGGMQLASDCSRWVVALKDCARALPDTSAEVKYGDPRRKIQCLIQFYDKLQQAFGLQTTDARRAQISLLAQPAGGCQLCTTEGIRKALGCLISNVLNATIQPPPVVPTDGSPVTLTAVVVGGRRPYTLAWSGPEGATPPVGDSVITATRPGTYVLRVTDAVGAQTQATWNFTSVVRPLKDRYNEVLKSHPQLTLLESRLNPELIGQLQTLATEAPASAGDQEALKRISAFLQKAQPLVDGVPVKIRIMNLSSPWRLKTTNAPGDRLYNPGDMVTIASWKIGRPVTLWFKKPGQENDVRLRIDDLIKGLNTPPVVPGITAVGGGPVTLQYEIVQPEVSDETIPLLEPVP